MTKEQEISQQRLRRLIEREGLSGAMNDTKWRELSGALLPISGLLSFRRKDVDQAELIDYWDRDIYHALAGWKSIEYLDIKAKHHVRVGLLVPPRVVDHTSELITALEGANVRYVAYPDFIRVQGYLRPWQSD